MLFSSAQVKTILWPWSKGARWLKGGKKKEKKRRERKAGGGGSRGGSGASYTCASLTSDKRIFQPTGAYRVHESTGQCRKGGWQKRHKDWEGLKWAGFCVTTWRSGRISFYPQCTDSKEFLLRRHLFLFLETVFFLSVSEADWESCSFFFVLSFFGCLFFNVSRPASCRSIPQGSWAAVSSWPVLIGCSCCCRGDAKGSELVCHLE